MSATRKKTKRRPAPKSSRRPAASERPPTLQQAKEALREANQKLAGWTAELERRTREFDLLIKMGELLQTSASVEKTYTVIGELARQLFPDEAGVLYTMNDSGSLMIAVASWGAARPDPPEFEPNDCWGLWLGRLHVVERGAAAINPSSDDQALFCRHLQRPWPAAYVCVPLVGQKEALGVLHLRRLPQVEPARSPEAPDEWFTEAKKQFVRNVAYSLALTLANLNLRETLRQQSIRDPLTGLFNRRYMEESLEREVHRVARLQRPLGVIMMDIDHFKSFNDTFGHEAGDSVLCEMGVFLRSQVRGEDIACRYGGEEFALILPEASLDVTWQRAEKLREEVKHLNPQSHGQSLGSVMLSLGVAVYPLHGFTGAAVIRAADAALYRAKQEERDRVVVAGQ